MNRRKLIAKTLVAWALALVCLVVPSSSLGATQSTASAPLFWGAQIGTQITGTQAPWDIRPVTEFEKVAGKGLSLVALNSSFADCTSKPCAPYVFPTPAMENARRYGAIPFLSWASTTSPESLDKPELQLSDLAAGRYDDYIRQYAAAAKAWGHPFFLRFNWEMNGFWFPWSEGVNGNRPGQFVAAWRHVHDIFTAAGATNATWVWCPNVNITGELQNLKPLYPGSSYVDWTCLDGFNWGKRHGSPGWLSFDQIFRKTYQQIVKLAPSKPMVIGETATTNRGGDPAHWISDALRRIRTGYRKVRGLIWFDVNDRGTNWPIETSSQKVRNAFRRGIRNPAYSPNLYANLPFGPVQPPN
jgi:hypothetical protein